MLTGSDQKHSFFSLVTESATMDQLILPAKDAWKNTLVLSGNRQLGLIEPQMMTKLSREYLLRKALDSLLPHFDLVLIDLPPTINTLTVNALVCADGYLVPTDLSEFSRRGIDMVTSLAKQIVNGGLNSRLNFLGIFITGFQKGGSHAVRSMVAQMEKAYPGKLLEEKVPHSVKVTESNQKGVPVGSFETDDHAVNLAFRTLCLRILNHSQPSMQIPSQNHNEATL